MVSEKKARANAANGKRSRGPKTASGKATSGQNAVRHGLSVGLQAGTPEAAAVAELTAILAQGRPDAAVVIQAGIVAECTVTLDRIARLRSAMSAGLPKPVPSGAKQGARALRLITAAAEATVAAARISLSEAKYKAGRAKGRDAERGANPQAHRERILTNLKALTEEKPDPAGAPLSRAASELVRLHRYERRALSRRKTALRKLDALLADDARSA